MKRNSRYENAARKNYLRNILLSVSGIFVIIIFLIFFGIPFLINLSLFSQNFRSANDVNETDKKISSLAPPVIDQLPSAQKENKIDITGYALAADKVTLYLNNKIVEETATDDEGKFAFRKIVLKEGPNTIKAKSQKNPDIESALTKEITVIFKKNPPVLEIESPADNTEIEENKPNRLEIRGKTDPDSRVTINDFWAIVDDEGKFSYLYNLTQGENKLKIKAIDEAGNISEKEIKVNKK